MRRPSGINTTNFEMAEHANCGSQEFWIAKISCSAPSDTSDMAGTFTALRATATALLFAFFDSRGLHVYVVAYWPILKTIHLLSYQCSNEDIALVHLS